MDLAAGAVVDQAVVADAGDLGEGPVQLGLERISSPGATSYAVRRFMIADPDGNGVGFFHNL